MNFDNMGKIELLKTQKLIGNLVKLLHMEVGLKGEWHLIRKKKQNLKPSSILGVHEMGR